MEKVCLYRTCKATDGTIVHELRGEKQELVLVTTDFNEVKDYMCDYN